MKTPIVGGYGGMTPMHGSATPMVGSQTPMAGGMTPMAGGRTPMAGGRTPMPYGEVLRVACVAVLASLTLCRCVCHDYECAAPAAGSETPMVGSATPRMVQHDDDDDVWKPVSLGVEVAGLFGLLARCVTHANALPQSVGTPMVNDDDMGLTGMSALPSMCVDCVRKAPTVLLTNKVVCAWLQAAEVLAAAQALASCHHGCAKALLSRSLPLTRTQK